MTEQPRCDFRSTPNPVWLYPAEDFSCPLAEKGIISEGGWVTCEPCHGLIEAGDLQRLSIRSMLTFVLRIPGAAGKDCANIFSASIRCCSGTVPGALPFVAVVEALEAAGGTAGHVLH